MAGLLCLIRSVGYGVSYGAWRGIRGVVVVSVGVGVGARVDVGIGVGVRVGCCPSLAARGTDGLELASVWASYDPVVVTRTGRAVGIRSGMGPTAVDAPGWAGARAGGLMGGLAAVGTAGETLAAA